VWRCVDRPHGGVEALTFEMCCVCIDLMVEWNKDLYGTSEKSPRDRKARTHAPTLTQPTSIDSIVTFY